MGNNLPGVNPRTFNDLIPGVKEALQNKTNITNAQCATWIQKTVNEFSENYELEELKVTGPVVTIGPGLGLNGSNFEYPISMFLQPGDDYTKTFDPVIFLSPTTAQTVGLVSSGTNSNSFVGYGMQYMSVKAIQPLLFIPGGIPFKYTRMGTRFWFGTQPGSNYQVYLPYQKRYPINLANVAMTQLYFPAPWEQIIEYAAALRGAYANRWSDAVKDLRAIIYGDPKNPYEPGLMKALMPQNERDAAKSTRQVMPMVSRY
jgi:hypothetical protein